MDAEDRAHHLASARKTGQKLEKGLSFRGHQAELRSVSFPVPVSFPLCSIMVQPIGSGRQPVFEPQVGDVREIRRVVGDEGQVVGEGDRCDQQVPSAAYRPQPNWKTGSITQYEAIARSSVLPSLTILLKKQDFPG